MKSDGVRGHLDLLLLAILAEGPRHGYSVIVALRERSDQFIDLAEGAVYPALHRLEEDGLLTSSWAAIAGRRRRLYQLTSPGKQRLVEERRHWRVLRDIVDALIGPGTASSSRLIEGRS